MEKQTRDGTRLAACLCVSLLVFCLAALGYYLRPVHQETETLENVGDALGMVLIDIPDEKTADSYHVQSNGVYVLAVQKNSQADKAGIASGDRLVSVNASPVQSAGEFVSLQQQWASAQEISLECQRGNDGQSYTVMLVWTAE